jgi:tetratricopeptide (TPR) repeat protein
MNTPRRTAFLAPLLLCFVLFLQANPAGAQDASSPLTLLAERARAAYDQNRFEEAGSLYEVLADSGGDGADVHYNLGNCYLRTGELGRAILEYRRALRYEPGLEPARHNLEVARELLPSRKTAWQPPPWEVFLRSIPQGVLEAGVISLAWAGNLCFILVLFLSAGRLRKRLVAGAAGLLAAAALGGGLLYFSVTVLPGRQPIVVLIESPIYPNPAEDTEPIDRLPTGTEAIRITHAGDWSLVLWGEGRGWTPSEGVEAP